MPLRKADWQDYFNWVVKCFRLALCGV
ncbi:hypothetical protein [Coxiella-like endosymbiont of Rhipicephalus sanguineus]